MKMLTTKEVSEKLRMGINQTRELIKLPSFPKIIVGKRKYLISEEELELWIKNNMYKNLSI